MGFAAFLRAQSGGGSFILGQRRIRRLALLWRRMPKRIQSNYVDTKRYALAPSRQHCLHELHTTSPYVLLMKELYEKKKAQNDSMTAEEVAKRATNLVQRMLPEERKALQQRYAVDVPRRSAAEDELEEKDVPQRHEFPLDQSESFTEMFQMAVRDRTNRTQVHRAIYYFSTRLSPSKRADESAKRHYDGLPELLRNSLQLRDPEDISSFEKFCAYKIGPFDPAAIPILELFLQFRNHRSRRSDLYSAYRAKQYLIQLRSLREQSFSSPVEHAKFVVAQRKALCAATDPSSGLDRALPLKQALNGFSEKEVVDMILKKAQEMHIYDATIDVVATFRSLKH